MDCQPSIAHLRVCIPVVWIGLQYAMGLKLRMNVVVLFLPIRFLHCVKDVNLQQLVSLSTNFLRHGLDPSCTQDEA